MSVKRLDKHLSLVVDMYGCPNRCRHCWLGHMPNRRMEEGADEWIFRYFEPYFENITFYSWLREPDYCDDYRERWSRDIRLSRGIMPRRFELGSFWRIVRDEQYVKFLKEVGVQKVQLTFFGLEEFTDRYVGRKGAFRELIQTTQILIENGITPRWQAFINEENKDEVVQLLPLIEDMKLYERCEGLDAPFSFFVHAGSCDGENRKLYDIRIKKQDIPRELIPCFLHYEDTKTEREWCELLGAEESSVVYHNEGEIVLNISNRYDVFFNFTHMSPNWRIGNLKTDGQDELIRRILEEDTQALNLARNITLRELVEKYGDPRSDRAFERGDYTGYLLNCYVDGR
ncbi:MAG: radical SAM protein [Acetatifactor sp.]